MDEVVVPDKGATEAQVNWDWTMLAGVSGMERGYQQWVQLLGYGGLVIKKIWTYDGGRGDAVIVAAPLEK